MRSTIIPQARSLAVTGLALVLLAGCGSDTPTQPQPQPQGLTIADLVGSWRASSFVITNKADATEKYDVVASGGELRSTILSHGGARTWLDIAAIFSDEWDAQLTISGTQLTSTPVEQSRPTRRYTAALTGNQLTLTSTDGTFDFTLSGASPVPVAEVIVFLKQ